MATPAVVQDGLTDFEAAVLNKFLSSKLQTKCYHGRILYNGTDFEVSTLADSHGVVDGDLSYNVGTDSVEITLAGFTNPPVIIPVKTLGATRYNVAGHAVSNTLAIVEFYAPIDGTKITGGADTNMDFQFFLLGF